MKSRLLDKTLELFKDRPRSMTFEDISKETGLPIGWLGTLGQGRNGHSVTRIETLYTYLSGKELDL